MEEEFDGAQDQGAILDQQVDQQDQQAQTKEVPETPIADAAPAAKPEYDVATDPKYQELQRQYEQAQGFTQSLLDNPRLSPLIHAEFGLTPPTPQVTPEQEIQQLRSVAQQNPHLAGAVEEKIWGIRQSQAEARAAQSAQQAAQQTIQRMLFEAQLNTTPEVQPYVGMIKQLEQRGIDPRLPLAIIGEVLRVQGAGGQASSQGGGGFAGLGNPNQATRDDVTKMSLKDFDKKSKASWRDQFGV